MSDKSRLKITYFCLLAKLKVIITIISSFLTLYDGTPYHIETSPLICKPMDWFLYDRYLRLERIKSSLNAVLSTMLKQVFHELVHDEHSDKVVSHWYNKKSQRINQKKKAHKNDLHQLSPTSNLMLKISNVERKTIRAQMMRVEPWVATTTCITNASLFCFAYSRKHYFDTIYKRRCIV